jgi:hypothetical protein
MLQVFYLNVAYIAVPIHNMLQMFHLFWTYVASILSAGVARGARSCPLGAAVPACAREASQAGVEYKVVSMGVGRRGTRSYIHAQLLSLLVLAGCDRSAAASGRHRGCALSHACVPPQTWRPASQPTPRRQMEQSTCARVLHQTRRRCRIRFAASKLTADSTSRAARDGWSGRKAVFRSSNFQKFYKILCHIESLDVYMEY